MFISSLTGSTVLAAIMTFALILFLWLIDALAQGLPGALGDAVGHLSLLRHFTDFTEGIFDTAGLVLFSQLHCAGAVPHRPIRRNLTIPAVLGGQR